MTTSDAAARQLLELYRGEIRAFLLENEVATLEALDQNAELLERALAQDGDLAVGFLGEAQVGKSSLINALLDRHALPSGGTGPLTAQATRVVHAAENGLTVKYHGKRQLNQLAFAIARYLERRGEIVAQASDAEPELPSAQDDQEDSSAVVRAALEESAGDADTERQKADLGRYMLSQAQRILHFANPQVQGSDPANLVLLDGVRAILGQKALGDAEALAPYQERIAEVQKILGSTEELSESTVGGAAQFNRALKQRAAGWLSPMVSELHLCFNADMLQGLSLVDLPGVGVLNDPAGQEAERFVRTEGDALVVVLRPAGITVSIADLLERTSVITKLLFGGSDDVPPIQVVFVVTHLDDTAKDRYSQLAREARDNGDPPPDRHKLFLQLSVEMEETVRQMVRDALRNSHAFDDLPDDQRAAREKVIKRLCDQMRVFCVASPDYLSIADGIDDGGAFLRNPEVTNVPGFRRHLRDLARDAAHRRLRAIDQFARALRVAIGDHLTALATMYEEGRGAAIQEFERFRDAIDMAAEPLRQEMRAYHGEAMGVLRKAMQAELQMICKDAQIAGMKKLSRLTKHGETLYYASLRAALVRAGVWDKRQINYPEALTLAMVDAIASRWEPSVVEKVRTEIRTLADRDLKLVEELCDAARAVNEKMLADTPIEVQKKILQANSRTAVAWTKEQLEDLRTRVSSGLRNAVEKPIERACKKAEQAGKHVGDGARRRILAAFEEGGEAAIEEARSAAEGLLKDQYSALLRKLNEGFLRENHDPIQAAVDTLTGEQIARARRADAQRKRRVTSRVEEFFAALAGTTEAIPSLPSGEPWHSAIA